MAKPRISAGHLETLPSEKDISPSSLEDQGDPSMPFDPDDPINWPLWAKYMTYGTICFYTFLATVNASNLSVAIVPLTQYFHTTATRASYLVCFNTLMLGVGNIFWVPLMRVVGRRPTYLFAMMLLMACNVWSYEAKTYDSLLAARILSGFAAAAGDAPVTAVAADLFPVTERGFVMMFFQFALSCGFFLGPLINAYVAQYTGGWRWTCGWIAIAAGVNCVVAVFTLWETSYPNRDLSTTIDPATKARRGMISNMSLKRGYNRNISFLQSMYDILVLAIYPPVTWGGILVGVFVGWNIIIQLESSVFFVAPPYRWQLHSIGLLALSGFVGTVLAVFVGGKLIDIISNSMTTRHGGVRKPEYRLTALIIPAVIGPVGILIFGLTAAAKTPWIGPAIGYCLQGFGLTACGNIMATYAIDCCPGLAGEALVFFFAVRAIIACILALFGFDWIAVAGIRNAFGQMVGIQYAVLLLGLLFYFRGKQIRKWTESYGPLRARADLLRTENFAH